MSREYGLTKSESENIMESFLEIMKASLESGEDILITGFGKFCVKYKPERKVRNPNTGEDQTITARRIVAFQCSRKLREKANRV